MEAIQHQLALEHSQLNDSNPLKILSGKLPGQMLRLAGALCAAEVADRDVTNVLGGHGLNNKEEMVNFLLDVATRAQEEKGGCSGNVQTLVVGSDFQGRYPDERTEEISLEAVIGAKNVIDLSVAAMRPLIGLSKHSTLTAHDRVDADQLTPSSFSPRALELLHSAVSTSFTVALLKDGIPIFRERASKESKKHGLSNDRCHLEAMVQSGILAVLVHGNKFTSKYYARKVPTAELTTEQKLALNLRLLAVGLNMDIYSAHAVPFKIDVSEAVLGPVCSDLPPGVTGSKAPGFLSDVPTLALASPQGTAGGLGAPTLGGTPAGLALTPTQARDSPGPLSLEEETSSCSGTDSIGSEQSLSDLGDGDSDRTKRPRSS